MKIAIYCLSLISAIALLSNNVFCQQPQQKLEAEIENLKKEIKMCAQYEESIIATIDKLNFQSKIKEKEMQLLNYKVKELENNIREINNSILELESKIKQTEEQIKGRIIASYKMGTLGYYRLLLYPENINTLIKSYQFISIISRKDLALINEYNKDKEKLINQKGLLANKQNDLIITKKELEQAKFSLVINIKEKRLILENIQSQKEMYRKAVNELNISAKKLENLISDFQPEKDFFEYLPDINKFRGLLPWPLDGKVIKSFGKIRHEKFNTYLFNKGIEISVREGSEVRVIFDGKVVFTDWFQGYGKMVIIEHKGHVFSIYAHNSIIKVKPGDIVHKGDVIAYSGSTGSLEGESLYFEIREGIEPVNPLSWLHKKDKAGLLNKKTVTPVTFNSFEIY